MRALRRSSLRKAAAPPRGWNADLPAALAAACPAAAEANPRMLRAARASSGASW